MKSKWKFSTFYNTVIYKPDFLIFSILFSVTLEEILQLSTFASVSHNKFKLIIRNCILASKLINTNKNERCKSDGLVNDYQQLIKLKVQKNEIKLNY